MGRGVALLLVALAVASVSASAAPGGGSRAAAPARIFFSSDRAADLYPQLFQVGLDGSGRRQLTDPTVPVGDPSLSPDGTKVVYSSGSELRVRDLASGADMVVAAADGDTKRLPKWSPDGGSIAYLDDYSDGSGYFSTSTLEAVGADGGTPRQLGPTDLSSGLAWSADGGEIAYSRVAGGAEELAAARADGGGSRAITQIQYPAVGIGWSPDGSTVAYGQQVRGLYSVPAVGGEPTLLSADLALDPVFSPSGDRIAFATYPHVVGSHAEIATIRPDGSGERVLSANADENRLPAWSPDGSQLLEARSDPTKGTAEIVLLAADGSGERVVRRETRGTRLLEPFWARGGAAILYAAGLLENDRELYSMRPDGTGLRQVTHNTVDDADPAVSPDGRRLAFDRAPFDGTRAHPADLYLMRTDGMGLRRLTNTSNLGETQPAWSPDGKRLVFVRTRFDGLSWLVVLDLAHHTARSLTRPAALVGLPSWSRDGTWIAFRSYHQGFEISAVHPDGRARQTIVSTHTEDDGTVHGGDAPAWSPHGPFLAYLAGVNSVRELWTWSLAIENPATGDSRTLARNVAESRPAWSRSGSMLVYSTGSDLYGVATSGRKPPRLLQHAPGVSDEPSYQPAITGS